MEIFNKIPSFIVNRKNPEMIVPSKPTPGELKPLSDIDDQDGLRSHIVAIQSYRRNPLAQSKDPVKVIRDAIARALVFYYPFAGRLRECAARKLVVECTGEGAVFIEADADVALWQLGGGDDTLYPPFPYLDKLLYNVPGTTEVLNCPLVLIQVTRLTCGGFVFAMRINHTMCDGGGMLQFMSAIAELARGAEAPSVRPVWERHLLTARDPPCVTCTHREFDREPADADTEGSQDFVDRSLLFNATDISALRLNLPPHLRRCSSFDVAVACAWRCRVAALSLNPNEEVRVSCFVDCRKRTDPQLLKGYYGNAVVFPAAVTTAERLLRSPLHYAVELVRYAKSQATDEYVKSAADLIVVRGRPHFRAKGTYLLSGLMHAGFEEVDFGWGTVAYGGPAHCSGDLGEGAIGYVLPWKNTRGEKGVVVTMRLPANAADKFINELETTIAAARKSLFVGGASML